MRFIKSLERIGHKVVMCSTENTGNGPGERTVRNGAARSLSVCVCVCYTEKAGVEICARMKTYSTNIRKNLSEDDDLLKIIIFSSKAHQ